MPIKNVGTLLENLVVTEATLALLPFCHEQAPFEFLNSFGCGYFGTTTNWRKI
jgi:hypothetical protein